MTDGSVLTLDSAVSQNVDDKITCKYMSLKPIKVLNVKEVIINGNVVELR